MIWSKGQIVFYVDAPSNVYAQFSSSTMTGTWPFDSGPEFVLLNMAVGGSWPGSPDNTTTFPATMQVRSVKVFAN